VTLLSGKATQLHAQSLVWDTHACFPLKPNASLSELVRYKNSGVDFVSINIGMDMDAFDKVIRVLAGFRSYIKSHPDDCILAESVKDIRKAKTENKVAIAFDLEGSEPLNGDINLISFYYDLGVRQMLLAYNKDNRASGGCMEGEIGLTDFGRPPIWATAQLWKPLKLPLPRLSFHIPIPEASNRMPETLPMSR
jgi:membrane dipeptidase